MKRLLDARDAEYSALTGRAFGGSIRPAGWLARWGHWRGWCLVEMGFARERGAEIVSQLWPRKWAYVRERDLAGFLKAHNLRARA